MILFSDGFQSTFTHKDHKECLSLYVNYKITWQTDNV